MDIDAAKDQLLRAAGFRYNFDRMAYINRSDRKIVSVEAIADNSLDWLRSLIADASNSHDWTFYFTMEPSPAVRQAFLAALNE